MVKKLELSQLFDPKENRLPKKTGIGGKLKPLKSQPLFDPKLMRNPRLKKELAIFDPTNAANIREKFVKKLASSIDTINKHLQEFQQFKGISFELNEEAARTFAIVRDKKTGEVLKQVPSEGILQIAANLRDLSGILVELEG